MEPFSSGGIQMTRSRLHKILMFMCLVLGFASSHALARVCFIDVPNGCQYALACR